MRPTDSGFTLIEIIVVILILGIIAGIAIVAFGNSHKSSVQSACKTNFQATALAIQSYQAENDSVMPESLISMSPEFINANLIDNGKFSLILQKFPNSYSVGVINTLGLQVKNGTLKQTSGQSYTYFVGDTSGISIGQDVYGTGLGSLVTAVATYSSGNNTLLMDNAEGISVGMTVSGSGVTAGTTVSSVDLVNSSIVVSSNLSSSGSSEGLIFGSAPKVSSINPDGTIVINGDGTSRAPLNGSRYTLIFGGQQLPGVAPAACLKL